MLGVSNKTKFSLYGGVFILVSNLITLGGNWGITFFGAITFVIGGIALPPLINFMSNKRKDNLYK